MAKGNNRLTGKLLFFRWFGQLRPSPAIAQLLPGKALRLNKLSAAAFFAVPRRAWGQARQLLSQARFARKQPAGGTNACLGARLRTGGGRPTVCQRSR